MIVIVVADSSKSRKTNFAFINIIIIATTVLPIYNACFETIY